MKQLFVLAHDTARARAVDAVRHAPEGYVIEIKETTRNLSQNAKLWAMLHDISVQADWHGMKLSPEEWKDLLSAGLTKSKAVPNLEGSGFVILGQRTSKMTKREFADLIEFIYAFGVDKNIHWTDNYRELPC